MAHPDDTPRRTDPTRPADPARLDEGLVPPAEPGAPRTANVGGGSTAGAGVAPPRSRGGKRGLVLAGLAVVAILLLLLAVF